MLHRPRAVFYLRLSLSVDDSTSIARQEAELRELAEREGWAVERILADDGLTGRKARANADEALRMIRDGEAEVLAVFKLDRWTRQGLGAVGKLIDTLDATPGSLFVAVRDGLRSDQNAWRIIAAVLAEVARTSSEDTSTRAKSAIAYRKSVTLRFTGGGTIPFGYASAPAPDGPGRVLEVYPPEAAIVREVAGRLLARTESLSAIARDLTERGIPTSKSPYRRARYLGAPDEQLERGTWTVSTIKALWQAPSLLGRTALGDDVVRDRDGLPVQAWEPILDSSTHASLVSRLAAQDGQAPRRRAARLLSGVAFCAYCDRKMYVTTSGGRSVYACPGSWNGDTRPSPKIDAVALETYVAADFLRARGLDPEVETVERVSDPGTLAELADVEHALQDASAAMLDDDVDPEALMRRIQTLKARRTILRETPATVSVEIVPTGRTLSDAWAESDSIEYRRSVLLTALDHVAVGAGNKSAPIDAERVRFYWQS